MTIRTRIALVFTLLTAAVMLLLSGFVYVLSLRHGHEYFFTRLKVRASITAESQFGDVGSTIVQDIRERHLQRLPSEEEHVFKNDSSLYTEMKKAFPGIPGSFIDRLAIDDDVEYNNGFAHYAGIRYKGVNGTHIVVAFAYDENSEDQMRSLLNILLFGFSASCLLVFFAGRIFAVRIMQPVSSMISRVHDITASNMSVRLEKGSGNDELAEMARTFNNMLDRLETTFELQSNFISNASHELRTPLTAILGEAEIILQSSRKPDEYAASIKTIQCEAKKLDDVTTSLLTLSQISFDGKKQRIEPVSLDELLISIKVTLDKRIPGNRVDVMLPPDDENADAYSIVCVRIWMELALTNLIQNSIKYSDNKDVRITFSTEGEKFSISIEDFGIGIPQPEIQHIFEPFFRASNTSSYAGHGIGLPLAARIIRLHGGEVSIQSSTDSGTIVSLKFNRQTLSLKPD